MRVLFLGAQPDDMEYYCAGTMARYAARGDEVYVAIATNGNIGSHVVETKEELAQIRHKEAQDACDIIGAKLIWMGIDDEYLLDTREHRDLFIDAVREARPDVMFTTFREGDYNPDHDMASYLSFIARINATIPLIKTKHPATEKIVPMFYCPPTGLANFQPDYYVDVSDTFDTRYKMWKTHASQSGEWNDKTFNCDVNASLTRNAEHFAFQTGSGIRYAEAFILCKTWPIGAAEPHKLLP